MSDCKHCGGEIEFRYDGGRVVPIRITCRCGEPGSAHSNQQSECAPTYCPRCHKQVFFVRHNGGSVWLDDLGPPWPQHACMHSDKKVKGVFDDYAIPSPAPRLVPLAFQEWRLRYDFGRQLHFFKDLTGNRHQPPVCLVFDAEPELRDTIGFIWFCSSKDWLLFGPKQRVLRYAEQWSPCRKCGTPYPPAQIAAHEAGHQ